MTLRRSAGIAALAGLVAGLLTMTTDPVGIFYDDAIYLLTAKALAEGQGYVYPHLPGTPPAIHYPPGWPALLALLWKLLPPFPGSVPALKLVNPVLLGAAAAGMTVAGQRLLALPWWLALGAAAVAAASIPVLALTNVLLSEPLFLALLFPALLACERAAREGGTRTAVVAAALTAALVLTRTIGGVLCIAMLLVLLRDRRWRELSVYAGVTVLLLLPWQLFVWRAGAGFPDELRGSYGPYLEWVADGYRRGGWDFLGDVVAQNTRDAWRMLGVLTAPMLQGAARHAVAALGVVALAAAGAAAWWRLGARVVVLALAGYLAAVAMWPYQTERFLWAVWPWVLLVLAAGLHALRAAAVSAGRTRAAVAVTAAGVVLAAGHLTYNGRALARGWADSASEQMTAWTLPLVRYALGEPRFEGRVIATDGSPMVALYTGLQVVPVDILTPEEHLRAKSPERFAEELAAIDRRYAPAAYVFLPLEGRIRSLALTRLDGGRRLVEVTPPGLPVRVFSVEAP